MDESELMIKQEQRTFLRERYLRAMNALAKKNIEIQMCEKTKVQAIFGSSDIDGQIIHVMDLETVTGIHPHALLRTSDILTIKIGDSKPEL